MLTSFDQVREWITDNGFKRWVLYRDRSKTEKILDSATFPSDMEDKLAMTEKYLRLNGGHAYAVGAGSNATSDLSTVCEITLSDSGAAGVGNTQYPPLNIGEIEERVRKQVRAELREAELSKREKDVAEREKELEAEKQTGMATLFHLLKPVGQVLIQKGILKNVAGTDTQEPYHAQPIIPKDPEDIEAQEREQEQEVSPWDDFTDAEGEEIGVLMARFKKAEPENWLAMMRKMVDMAEKNDTTYQMARNFLIA